MCLACELSDVLSRFVSRQPSPKPGVPSAFPVNRRRFLSSSLACVAVGLPAAGALAAAAPAGRAMPVPGDGTASTVFRNGRIYTVNPGQPWAEAVAVTGETVTFVGSDEGTKAHIGPQTRVVDLAGQMLMPGFIEGHIHPFLGSFFTSGVDLQLPTRQAAFEAIADYVKAHPTGTLRGFGWRMDMFGPNGPTAAELDRVVPDRPAMMFSIDVHSVWINSKALETAGITATTADPIPGFSYYQRDAQGHPTGFVLEMLAMLPVVGAIEPITINSMSRLLGEWMPKAAGAGITSIFDAAVPPIGNDEGDIIKIYADYEARGELPFRVVACHAAKGPPIDNAVATVQGLQSRFRTPLVDVRVLKIVADGTQEGWTALMLAPYTDKPDTLGAAAFSAEQITQLIAAADKAGIDVHVHACGDATVRRALDGFEAAIAANPARDRRNTIAHLVMVDDADMPRFSKLGVNGQFSINWHSLDPDATDIIIERCGRDRQARIYRPGTQLRSGGRISAGTDWPAAGYFSTYKPLEAIQIGVTRKLLDKTDKDPCLTTTDECLTLEQALAAYTTGAAHQLRLEHKVGSIEVGKAADLIVIDKNLFDLPSSEIGKASVKLTMMNGVVTHGTLA